MDAQDVVAGWHSPWEGLSPEILGQIFSYLPSDEVARSAALVCRSWSYAVAGPYSWPTIDIDAWCRRCERCQLINCVVRRLITRTNATVRRLSASMLDEDSFPYVAACGKYLEKLTMQTAQVTDKMVFRHSSSFIALRFLDISFCMNITFRGIEAIGKHCTSLVHFKRCIPLPAFDHNLMRSVFEVDESEAFAVASTMRSLRALELCYGRFSDEGLRALLNGCRNLISLDILGCLNVKLDADLEDRCFQMRFFRVPWEPAYDFSTSSGDGDGTSAESSPSGDDINWENDTFHLEDDDANRSNVVDVIEISDDVIEISSDDSDVTD